MIDLSHPLSPRTPLYPGTDPVSFDIRSEIEKDGYRERRLALSSHTGTHVDAPSHMIPGGLSLDRMPLDRFYGPALVMNLNAAADRPIDTRDLEGYQAGLRRCHFALIHTGWSRFWGGDRYFSGFPFLSAEAAEWLGGFDLKGVGVDTPSVDQADSTSYPAHQALMKSGLLIIENLTNLGIVPAGEVVLACFPLKIEDADGSPVRAVAMIQ